MNLAGIDIPLLPFKLARSGDICVPFPPGLESACAPAFTRMTCLRALVAVTRWYEQLIPPQVRKCPHMKCDF